MHITSPANGSTITTGSFTVSGTFDTAQTGNFKLTATVGSESHEYDFTVNNSTTWGPVTVNPKILVLITIKILGNLIFPYSFESSTSKLYDHYKKEKNQ